jgi:membrane protein implicated in regulation of membrane protease activity
MVVGVHGWIWWVVAAVLLLLAESATATLICAMTAIGAVAAALLSVAGVPFYGQLPAFVVVSLGMTAFIRPLMRRMQSHPGLRTGIAALVGSDATVADRVDAHGGRIRLDGQVWTARPLDPQAVFEVGDVVHVAAIDGATAIVV